MKDAGCRLICQVQTFDDVDLALAAGADVLVAQGTEAGGHTGTMTLLPLLCGIADEHPEVPLLAAGGIGSGRALATALFAGADGAWLGTAFLATPEAVEIGDDLRDAIVASDGTDTVFARAYDIVSGMPWPAGIGERVRRDTFTDTWAGTRGRPAPRQARDVTPPRSMLFGQSAHFVSAIRPAGDVVRSLSQDAERLLHDRPRRCCATPSAISGRDLELLEAVADTARGLDAVRHRTELLAEAAHDDIHDVASADVRRAPDLLDELGAGHGAARSFGQRREHAELEGRELNPLLSEIDGAVCGVEEPSVGDSELGGGEAGQPAVDGLGSEVECRKVEGVIADGDGFREGLESQHRERVRERGGIGERRCRSDRAGDASGSSAA